MKQQNHYCANADGMCIAEDIAAVADAAELECFVRPATVVTFIAWLLHR